MQVPSTVPMSAQVNPMLVGKTILMVCVNQEGYISKNGRPILDHKHWEDRRKRLISGHTIVLGRKAFEALGSKPIEDVVTIVLSTTLPKNTPGVFIARTLTEVQACYAAHGKNLLYWVGGGSIYKQKIDSADIIMLTQTQDHDIGDVPMGFSIDQSKWGVSMTMPISQLKEGVLEFAQVAADLKLAFMEPQTAEANDGIFQAWFESRFLPMAAVYRNAKATGQDEQKTFLELWSLWGKVFNTLPAPRRVPFMAGHDVAVNFMLELSQMQASKEKPDYFELLRMRMYGLTEISKETRVAILAAEEQLGKALADPDNRVLSHTYVTLKRKEVAPVAVEQAEAHA